MHVTIKIVSFIEYNFLSIDLLSKAEQFISSGYSTDTHVPSASPEFSDIMRRSELVHYACYPKFCYKDRGEAEIKNIYEDEVLRDM